MRIHISWLSLLVLIGCNDKADREARLRALNIDIERRLTNGTALVTFHVVSETGAPAPDTKLVRLNRVLSPQAADQNLLARVSDGRAALPWGKYEYEVQCQHFGKQGTAGIYVPRALLLIDCGFRDSDATDIGASSHIITKSGRVVPLPRQFPNSMMWITFVSATGFPLPLDDNVHRTVPVASDGSFEVYGLREGRYVALVFSDGNLLKAAEFRIESMTDSAPIVIRLDSTARARR